MEIKDFINDFANQFDDTNVSEFKQETKFRELDEWSSLIGLAILNMIEKKYGIKLSFIEMRKANTIEELFNIVAAKK